MPKTTIGLDIGTSAIRAAEVRGKAPVSLVRFAQLGLPAGAVVAGEIADADAVASTVRELWKRGGFKAKQVSVAVSNQAVVVRQVELPRMELAELREALPYQVQDYIPIPIEEAILDFVPLDEFVGEDGQEMLRVLAVAAQAEMVTAVVGVLTRAGLDPVDVDIAPLALVRAMTDPEASLLADREAEAIIDMGAGVTNVVVHEHGTPRFVRILTTGGNEITAALVQNLEVEPDEAESQKVALGVSEESGASETGAAAIIEEQARVMIDDIRRSIEYYATQPDAAPVARAVLLGGGGRLGGLRARLERALGVPVAAGDALGRVRVDDIGLNDEQLQQVSAVAAVAVGLALEE